MWKLITVMIACAMTIAIIALYAGCDSMGEFATQHSAAGTDGGLLDSPLLTDKPPREDSLIQDVRTRPDLQEYTAALDSAGFVFSRRYSFAIEGIASPPEECEWPDGVTVGAFPFQNTTLAFLPGSGDTTRARYLEYIETDYVNSMILYELVFSYANVSDDHRFVTDGVWRRDLSAELTYGHGMRLPVGAQACSFSEYLDCVEEETAAGCITALIVCAFSGPGYAGCAALGCGAAAAFAVVHCAFTAL